MPTYGRGTKGHYVYMKIATTVVADVPLGLFVQVIGCSCSIVPDCLFDRGKFSYFFFLFSEERLHFSCMGPSCRWLCYAFVHTGCVNKINPPHCLH